MLLKGWSVAWTVPAVLPHGQVALAFGGMRSRFQTPDLPRGLWDSVLSERADLRARRSESGMGWPCKGATGPELVSEFQSPPFNTSIPTYVEHLICGFECKSLPKNRNRASVTSSCGRYGRLF